MNTDASLKRLQIRVPPAMREPLKEHCKQIDKSPSLILLSLLKNYLEIVGAYDNE
ncbi:MULTISPECIES: hypothetical protein [Klebsiella pneumoniae complex]|uniref:hypothetical protein n=1 Tax=Klebsiella pneumoniae complex TaxID=3390273 RepID=UPI0021D93479|nr:MULTISPECIES: hypothetical protein [Klebsiella]EKT9643435.1 hypothetical protein [Pluralibacter gergoviae]EMD1659213.1 hypothetical protein [Pluralibacter gergoviae]MCU8815412.1 hypothetical protein [Klebsiella quasipneumoniae]MEE2404910.1 hypothetical protein [Klebsiella pneumoniae]